MAESYYTILTTVGQAKLANSYALGTKLNLTTFKVGDGGFMIREAGVFDDAGNMIAIGKYPETYKPVLADGSTKDLYIKMILEVSNTSVVNLKIYPSVVLATKKDITILQNQINNITIPVTKVNRKTGDITLKASDIKADDESVCYDWTPQQILVLGSDMSTFMTNTIKHKEIIQAYIQTLTTVEEVQKVVWDTVIPTT